MMTIREYARPATLEEAWQLNQKKPNRVLGGMLWLKMEKINVGTAIDLSALGLDTIEETDTEILIGAMATLRSGNERRPERLHRGGCAGGCAPHCRRAVPQLRHGGRQHLWPVRLFRCADAVFGAGLRGRAVQGGPDAAGAVCRDAL